MSRRRFPCSLLNRWRRFDCSPPLVGLVMVASNLVAQLPPGTNELAGGVGQLRILADRPLVEVFGGNGRLYMAVPVNNPASTSLIALGCAGGNTVFKSHSVSKLKSAWI